MKKLILAVLSVFLLIMISNSNESQKPNVSEEVVDEMNDLVYRIDNPLYGLETWEV